MQCPAIVTGLGLEAGTEPKNGTRSTTQGHKQMAADIDNGLFARGRSSLVYTEVCRAMSMAVSPRDSITRVSIALSARPVI